MTKDDFTALWALAGVWLVIAYPVVRLALRGLEAVTEGLSPGEWVAFGLIAAAFVYGEGVRALQRRWVPEVLEKIRERRGRTGWFAVVAAPLFAMSLFGGTRRDLVRAWGLVAGILLAVLIVRQLPEPWRGMVDLSVAMALAWSLIWISLGVRQITGPLAADPIAGASMGAAGTEASR